MKVKRIISDGTLEGTQILNELDLPAMQMLRRVTIDIDAGNPSESYARIEYYDMKEEGVPVYKDGDFIIKTLYLKLEELEVKVSNGT